jgi:hypothetical protein
MPGFEDVGKVINCELAEQNFALISSKSEVVARPLPKDDPRQRQPDIARAEKLSCWRPTVERDEGLRSTIALRQVQPRSFFARFRKAFKMTCGATLSRANKTIKLKNPIAGRSVAASATSLPAR